MPYSVGGKMIVAITGASGLLGQTLCSLLLENDMKVHALIKEEGPNNVLSPKVFRTYGDISNKKDVERFINNSKPDYFIHLAAQTQAFDSFANPYDTFVPNVLGTLNILESLREYGNCRAIAVASSDKAYGKLDGEEYREDSPLNGIFPYDCSKSITDLLCRSYRNTYDMPIATTRACNIYGIGDLNAGRLIPGAVNAYLKKSTFEIRNGGLDVREYISAHDVSTAYLAILRHTEKENTFDTFNIGSGDIYSTKDLFDLVSSHLNNEIEYVITNNESVEIPFQKLNSERIRTIGWSPKYTIKTHMKELLDWYKKIY
jgi:CDP-glucose 4,6-dehydratase